MRHSGSTVLALPCAWPEDAGDATLTASGGRHASLREIEARSCAQPWDAACSRGEVGAVREPTAGCHGQRPHLDHQRNHGTARRNRDSGAVAIGAVRAARCPIVGSSLPCRSRSPTPPRLTLNATYWHARSSINCARQWSAAFEVKQVSSGTHEVAGSYSRYSDVIELLREITVSAYPECRLAAPRSICLRRASPGRGRQQVC